MKKNLYYRSMFQRRNLFKDWFLSFFTTLASPARLLIEVFIRKNFGERYFRLSSVVTVTFILSLLPVCLVKISQFIHTLNNHYGFGDTPQTIKAATLMPSYLGWYVFLAAFLALGIRHHRDNRREASVFDFEKFSLSTGRINPLFFKLSIPSIKTDKRLVECLFEPALFFVLGILLWLIGQHLGTLLIFCSLCYALSYVRDYISGDNFIMDRIDEIICNEELEKSFVFDADEDETRGFSFRGQKPEAEGMRRKILPLMSADEEILEAT